MKSFLAVPETETKGLENGDFEVLLYPCSVRPLLFLQIPNTPCYLTLVGGAHKNSYPKYSDVPHLLVNDIICKDFFDRRKPAVEDCLSLSDRPPDLKKGSEEEVRRGSLSFPHLFLINPLPSFTWDLVIIGYLSVLGNYLLTFYLLIKILTYYFLLRIYTVYEIRSGTRFIQIVRNVGRIQIPGLIGV